jgi:hypothetical protein
MTYVTGDGPPDIDATHAWAPVTGTAPPTLNVAGAGGAAPVLPWIKVRAIDGWRDFPETIDNRAGRTFGVGEIAYPARVLGKTVVYQCEVQAATRESARGTLSLAIAGFGPAWTYTGRVIALDSDSTFTKLSGVWGPFRWGFTLSIRMSDPRFYTGGVGYF